MELMELTAHDAKRRVLTVRMRDVHYDAIAQFVASVLSLPDDHGATMRAGYEELEILSDEMISLSRAKTEKRYGAQPYGDFLEGQFKAIAARVAARARPDALALVDWDIENGVSSLAISEADVERVRLLLEDVQQTYDQHHPTLIGLRPQDIAELLTAIDSVQSAIKSGRE